MNLNTNAANRRDCNGRWLASRSYGRFCSVPFFYRGFLSSHSVYLDILDAVINYFR